MYPRLTLGEAELGNRTQRRGANSAIKEEEFELIYADLARSGPAD